MRSNRTTITKGLKWSALAILVLIVTAIIYSLITINDIKSQQEAEFPSIKKKVSNQTEISQINHIDVFYDAQTYHIVFGSTDAGDDKIVFLPSDGQQDLTIIEQNEIKSKQSIKQSWKQTCPECDLISTQAAMIDAEPLWELTYQDEQDRHVLDYISMNSGERYLQWKLKDRFK